MTKKKLGVCIEFFHLVGDKPLPICLRVTADSPSQKAVAKIR